MARRAQGAKKKMLKQAIAGSESSRFISVVFWIGSSAKRAFGGCLGDKRR